MTFTVDIPEPLMDKLNAISTDPHADAKRAYQYYDTYLHAALEPQYTGWLVAIDLANGDYAVARSQDDALNTLRARNPNGFFYVLRVGPPSASDLRLVRRTAEEWDQAK